MKKIVGLVILVLAVFVLSNYCLAGDFCYDNLTVPGSVKGKYALGKDSQKTDNSSQPLCAICKSKKKTITAVDRVLR